MVGRVVTVQSKQLYFAPCCATIQEYAGTGRDFEARQWWDPAWKCQHESARAAPRCSGGSASSGSRKPRPTCAAWHCQANALPRQHLVLDHLDLRLETYHLCHKHTPPEDWLRRAKNFRQFSETCRNWEIKVKNSHKK